MLDHHKHKQLNVKSILDHSKQNHFADVGPFQTVTVLQLYVKSIYLDHYKQKRYIDDRTITNWPETIIC